MLSPIEQAVLRELRRPAGVSRGELADALNLRPNTAGDVVAGLIELGLAREKAPEKSGPGRPRVPVALDPDGRTVLGIALTPGRLHVAELGLTGRVIQRRQAPLPHIRDLAETSKKLIGALLHPRIWSTAIAAPGLVDRAANELTLTGLTRSRIDLSPVTKALGKTPTVIDNDMHALAARWALTPNASERDDDALLIRFGDGVLGASMLVQGRPNRGCVIGGNELGHTRLPVNTPRCFCGQTGCLERIASSAFLHQQGASSIRTLNELCSAWPSGTEVDDKPIAEMLELLATGLGNAANFVRPHRLVLISELSRYATFNDALLVKLKRQMLPGIAENCTTERWDEPLSSPGETAAYLALAGLFDQAWLG